MVDEHNVGFFSSDTRGIGPIFVLLGLIANVIGALRAPEVPPPPRLSAEWAAELIHPTVWLVMHASIFDQCVIMGVLAEDNGRRDRPSLFVNLVMAFSLALSGALPHRSNAERVRMIKTLRGRVCILAECMCQHFSYGCALLSLAAYDAWKPPISWHNVAFIDVPYGIYAGYAMALAFWGYGGTDRGDACGALVLSGVIVLVSLATSPVVLLPILWNMAFAPSWQLRCIGVITIAFGWIFSVWLHMHIILTAQQLDVESVLWRVGWKALVSYQYWFF